MAGCAGRVVAADTPDDARWRALEFFPTPPWAARAGAELILRLDPEARSVWEPACGEGHMAHGLADYFPTLFRSDVHAHAGAEPFAVQDFLDPALDRQGYDGPRFDWIVTNPPFSLASEFVRLGLHRARRGVALLARASLLESIGRYELMFGAEGLCVFSPFIERVAMTLGGWDPKASTATAYAWFIWLKPELKAKRLALRPAEARDLGWPVVWPVPPGTKARLTHPDDAARFARRARPAQEPAWLLEGLSGPDFTPDHGDAP